MAVTRKEPAAGRAQRWFENRLTRKGLRPRYAAYLIIGFWVAGILVFGLVERLADPKTFPSIWLAWWWAIQTVTTVGYGDVVPRQTTGKVMASFLMLGGLSMLSIVTATVTSGFVARREAEARRSGEDPVMRELLRLGDRLTALEAELRHARGAPDVEPGAPNIEQRVRDVRP